MTNKFLIIALVLVLITTYNTFATKPEQTNLLVFLSVLGEHNSPGDEFELIVRVENIGDYNAIGATVALYNIPNDWKVVPRTQYSTNPFEVAVGTIKPGESKTQVYRVTRGQSNASIFATARAHNALQVSSEIIPVPINIIVTGLLGVLFITLGIYFVKKN